MTDTAKTEKELEIDKFEMAMYQAGWRPVKGKFGGTVEWKNRYRRVSHALARKHFQVTGQTPARML